MKKVYADDVEKCDGEQTQETSRWWEMEMMKISLKKGMHALMTDRKK